MSFRLRLLLLTALAVAAAVAIVATAVQVTARRAFEELDDQRLQALVAQFRREFERRGQEVARRVESLAAAESTLRLAIDVARRGAEAGGVNEAAALAAAHNLDFLELVADDGAIVSSAQWPARFGYKEEWVLKPQEGPRPAAFLRREELPESAALALIAVRTVSAGDHTLYLAGGLRLGDDFLASLVLPAGMRVLLFDVARPTGSDPLVQALVADAGRSRREVSRTVDWGPPAAGPETLQAIPLFGRSGELLAVLVVGSSRRELAALVRFIRRAALAVGAAGILLGVALSSWAAARVSRPVQNLAVAARQVAAGDWTARVDASSGDEIGELGRAFNTMTSRLLEQRERLVQAERVAAWRELARRLAHELKNPLFPLQITVENLQRAKDQHPAQFEEVFRESTTTLLAELANLKTILGRFSDFAKMPPPRFEAVQVGEIIRPVLKLCEAQCAAAGVTVRAALEEPLPTIEADPEQLGRALQNLVLNALDAMPHGGTLTIRARRIEAGVRLEVADTGAGLTPEECERLFTPYYTTKRHGTGLGLAIVQSVVSDHQGRIAVESTPGQGATFRLDLPEKHA